MTDAAIRRDGEDAYGRERPKYADQRQTLNPARLRERIDRHLPVWRDPISNADIGDQAKHSGNLEAPDQKVEGRPIVIYGNRFGQRLHPCPRQEVFGDTSPVIPDIQPTERSK